MNETIFDETEEVKVSEEDIDEALNDAILKLIAGVGSAEKEDVQEGTSKYSQENRQEQLKKDIVWLKNFKNSNEHQVGSVKNRVMRKRILDIEI